MIPPAHPARRRDKSDLPPTNWTVQNGNFLVISRLGDERIAMKVSKFSEQQIALILKQVDDGLGVDDVCRKAGVSQQTYYRWRKKYGGLMPSEVRRLKQLEEENRRLKQMVADLSLDKAMLQDVCEGAQPGRRLTRSLPGLDPASLHCSGVSEVELFLQGSPSFAGRS
jgi:putative transposase